MIQLKEYLERLDLPEAPTRSAASLSKLHQRHLLRVPFENLDIHRGVEIRLDQERILDKIVTRRRGGFCYELNLAFAWLLRELGFEVRLLSATVEREDGAPGLEAGHLALEVKAEGDWLCDVGFGDSFMIPLDLASRQETRQLGGRYRLAEADGKLVLERFVTEFMSFRPLYRFDREAREVEHFAAACRHHQESPDSPFTAGLICSIAIPDGRLSLTADRLILSRAGAKKETPLADRAAFDQNLKRHFGIQIDEPALRLPV